MSLRRRSLVVACLLAAFESLPPLAVAAEPGTAAPRVAIVDASNLPERMGDARARLHERLAESVRRHDSEPVDGAAACTDASCLMEVASSTGAKEVLVLRGGKTPTHGYRIELSLWNPGTRTAAPAVVDCTVCTGPQMIDAVAGTADALLDQLTVKEAQPLAQPIPVAQPTSSPPVPANPTGNDAVKLSPHRTSGVVGWSLVGLGVAAGVGGGVLWSFDGKGTDCVSGSCRSTYHTRTESIALLSGGAVALGVGLWLGLESSGHRGVAVSVGPSGALIAGTY
jgi:hypothetical protein